MDYQKRRRPSKFWICKILFWVFLVIPTVSAEELLRAKVTTDRVNVRVRPDINSEIVTQLGMDEEVVVLEKNEEWTKIKAPVHSKCWVHSECVEGVRIKSESVNMRCGPGLAFPVLAKLKKGTTINIIEVFGEWTRIEPPVEFSVWVSSKYLEPQITSEEPPEKVEVVEEKPQPQIISAPDEELKEIELTSSAGRLEDLGIIINRPGTYKLVDEKGKWLCIIKSPTLDVNPYINRSVRIEGVVLSKSSSWGVPVIELKRLSVIK